MNYCGVAQQGAAANHDDLSRRLRAQPPRQLSMVAQLCR